MALKCTQDHLLRFSRVLGSFEAYWQGRTSVPARHAGLRDVLGLLDKHVDDVSVNSN